MAKKFIAMSIVCSFIGCFLTSSFALQKLSRPSVSVAAADEKAEGFFLAKARTGSAPVIGCSALDAEKEVEAIVEDLGEIRYKEVMYFQEHGLFMTDQQFTPVLDRAGDCKRVPWDHDTQFSKMGFSKIATVPCSYSLEPYSDPETGFKSFKATVACDLDGDGEIAYYLIHGTPGDTDIYHVGAPY